MAQLPPGLRDSVPRPVDELGEIQPPRELEATVQLHLIAVEQRKKPSD